VQLRYDLSHQDYEALRSDRPRGDHSSDHLSDHSSDHSSDYLSDYSRGGYLINKSKVGIPACYKRQPYNDG
jgi:hypothetical protein